MKTLGFQRAAVHFWGKKNPTEMGVCAINDFHVFDDTRHMPCHSASNFLFQALDVTFFFYCSLTLITQECVCQEKKKQSQCLKMSEQCSQKKKKCYWKLDWVSE